MLPLELEDELLELDEVLLELEELLLEALLELDEELSAPEDELLELDELELLDSLPELLALPPQALSSKTKVRVLTPLKMPPVYCVMKKLINSPFLFCSACGCVS